MDLISFIPYEKMATIRPWNIIFKFELSRKEAFAMNAPQCLYAHQRWNSN
jgi:hypothetical protein